MDVRVRRVYEPPSPDDGTRVLVDRLWPRGLRKDALDARWDKDVAPSTELREAFHRGSVDFADFATRYRAELAGNPALDDLRAVDGPLTLLTATKDTDRNHALVLAEVLREDR